MFIAGWFVTYIDRDPETLAAMEKKAKKQKMDKDDAERMMDFIEKQVEKGRQETTDQQEEFKVPLVRPEDDAPLVIELKLKPKPAPVLSTGFAKPSTNGALITKIKTEPMSSAESEYGDAESPVTFSSDDRIKREKSESRGKRSHDDEASSSKRRKSSLKHSSEEDESKPVKEGWLREGIMVKVMTKSLGEKYYKAKGVVQSPVLESGFVGKVKLKSPEDVEGHVIKFDQAHLETVIPAIGKEILVVQGKYAGCQALVDRVRIDEFCVDVELIESEKIVKRLPYESICKFVGID